MERAKTISKSMISYLKRAREHKEFILNETKEFERGKRHLANMMGVQASSMNQRDIDDAIKYLFPSGLFSTRARPIMRPPDYFHKARKDAQFDIDGRPHHYLFYTITPNYNQILADIEDIERSLNHYEDEQLALGITNPPEDSMFYLQDKDWLGYEAICDKLLEPVTSDSYLYLIKCLERLKQHPYSNRAAPLFESFTIKKPDQSLNLALPEILTDEKTGQVYTEMMSRHRNHFMRVRTILNGSGKIDIDGLDILRFEAPYLRRAILFPLTVSNMLDRVDIKATSHSLPKFVGDASIAACVRYPLSISIAAFVDEVTREKMRLAGLLTIDVRLKERKKFGQEGARRKYTWKRR